MSAHYRVISWTPFKRRFDVALGVGITLYLALFVAVSVLAQPAGESIAEVQIIIRATGSLAFLLLCGVLAIGPLARRSERFRPYLYNRRHLGVATFLVALVHAALATLWYHGFGALNPIASLLVSNPRYDAIGGFPFESLGLVALLIFATMAATSHDFWNKALGPGLWKAIHLTVYGAFCLIVLHVLLGAVQTEHSPAYPILVGIAVVILVKLHLAAAFSDRAIVGVVADDAPWAAVAPLAEFAEDGRAKILRPPSGAAIAVFRNGRSLSAVENVCRHQGGPLGEGQIIDGCITCPWHGWQYRPEDGRSPPPFTEKIATYRLKLQDGVVMVDTRPLPQGTAVPPLKF